MDGVWAARAGGRALGALPPPTPAPARTLTPSLPVTPPHPLSQEHYAKRDPIPQLRATILAKGLATEAELNALDAEVAAIVEESVTFADESPKPDKGQLLENLFADPKGFGIAADGRYRYELPGFSSGTAEVS